ncbi:unnamed protein product [Ranitomeya imitator]|uniref:Anaphylatoxin-like domain-containing protein n=1 Tax=Ranitomeya imitator TaxID=111125 RepID=A0ABN9KT02_9NEOB|nr:unnamed protein product [Ranitomeya imitator]
MILLYIAVLLTLYGRGFSQEQTYLVMGPRMWRVGAQETVLIQAFGYKENLLITISLLSYPDKQKRFSTESLELNSDNNYQGRVTLRAKRTGKSKHKQCAICTEPLPDSYTKSLCQACIDNTLRQEESVKMNEIRLIIREELQSLGGGSSSINIEKKKRRVSSPRADTSAESGEVDSDVSQLSDSSGEEDFVCFPTEGINNLVKSVRNTMGVSESKEPQTPQEIMFAGLSQRKGHVFPINQAIKDLVKKEWGKGQKGLVPIPCKRRYPFDDEDLSTWTKIPKVDAAVASTSRRFSLPVEDAGSLSDPMDRKSDALLKKSWEACVTAFKPAIAATCTGRSMLVWLDQLEQNIKNGVSREKLRASIPLIKVGAVVVNRKIPDYVPIRPNDFPRKDGATQFVCLQAKTSSFTKEERVPVSHHNGFLFIQSDKPVYTPDQSVKVRIYSMDEELRPARRAVTVTFKDPDEVKMDVITQQDATGIISFPDFKIPANPKNTVFMILHYTRCARPAANHHHFYISVLPRFFVTIVPSQNFISYDTFDEFTITVKANYYYGKKLEQAKVFIRYGIIQGGERRMMTKSIDVLTMIGGEAVFQFNSRRAVDELGFSQLEELDGSYLYITISVEETAGSQSEESENADVRYVITPYTLKLIGTPLYVKPTLPYYVKVQVKDTLDKAVPRIRLSLTGEMVQDDGEVSPLSSYHSQIQMTDGKGIAEFVVNIPADVTILEFTIKTADKNLQDENQARSTYTATAYKSPTKSYLYINWARESEVMHVGGYLNVQVVPKSPYMAKLTHYSYLVISKGKIITYNTVQRVHDSTSQNLNIQITSAMVPSIRLLVYYIITGDSTAEVVADSIWVDVREKCINNQEVQLSTKKRVFQPKASVPLTVQAQTGSIVALSAVDVSVYDVTKKTQRPMDRVLRRIEESDLGCGSGAGAGKDNKEVFELAGLTFITNANIRASQTTAFSCNDIIRSKRSDTLGAAILKAVSTYKDKRLRQCCEAGGRAFTEDRQCVAGIARIQKDKGQPCVNAFSACCEVVQAKDHELAQKNLDMGRMCEYSHGRPLSAPRRIEEITGLCCLPVIRTVFDLDEPEIRSYFPESWLWEELSISDRRGFKETGLTLPDSLTTWEIQGIGMSDQGLCVADPAQITVSKDVFIDVQLPYSVIRGEQVEIQVTVYNYQNSKVKAGHPQMILSIQGVYQDPQVASLCLWVKKSVWVSELKIGHRGKAKDCNEEFNPEMPRVFTYNILPLALGLHTINFTLNVQFNSEKVVKTLRVVSEGIKMEQSVGFTLDPLGLRGVTKRQQDLPYRIPANTVPKSGINRIFSINGNIMGEVIDSVLNSDGVKYLVSMPKGNAEMELARVAPIFYVYHYLETKQQWSLLEASTLTAQLDMKLKLKEGVRSVLAFRNRDYSYSLWRDSQPSTWMTAFALRIFGDVHRYVAIDQMSVCTTLLWLVDNCQDQDGSFKEKSTSSPVKLQGTIPREASEKTLYLTAYTVIAIQKAFHMCPVIISPGFVFAVHLLWTL